MNEATTPPEAEIVENIGESEPIEGFEASVPQSEFDKLKKQNEELLRTLAEFENIRKRNQRDNEAERKYAASKIVGDLLPAFDNLDRAIAAAKQSNDQSPLVMGVMATQMQILEVLKRHGVTPIKAEPGVAFDPNVHQAVGAVPHAEFEPNSVVQTLQNGFMIHDRVLRPASVVVSTKPPTES